MVLKYNQYNHFNMDVKFIQAFRGDYKSYANVNAFLVMNNNNGIIDNFILNIEDYFFTGNNMSEIDTLLDGLSFVICNETYEQTADDINKMKQYIPVYVDDLTYYYYFFKNKYKLDYVHNLKGNISYFRIYSFEFRCLGVLCDLDFDSKCDIDYVKSQKKRLKSFTQFDETVKYSNLPLTQIKFVKNKLRTYKANDKKKYTLLPFLGVREYQTINKCWSGGICSYNKKFLGRTYKNVISYDFKSAYSSVMCKYALYPVEFVEYKECLKGDEYLDKITDYAVIGQVLLANFKKKENRPGIKTDILYNDTEKCKLDINVNVITDLKTDEVVSASIITLNLTDIDFLTISKFYDFDIVGATECYIYKRGYLPQGLRACVLYFFHLKETKPKDSIEYILAKKALNSIFGINFVDPAKTYRNIENATDLIEPKPTKGIHEIILEYNQRQEEGKNFTSYHWGLYICALQRLELSNFIEKAIELDIWMYSDTDSLKVRNTKDRKEFDKFVKEWNNKHKAFMCKILKEDTNLGILVKEEQYKRFKVLGKKQYFYETDKGVEATMSGISKARASEYLNSLDNPFRDINIGSVLPKMKKSFKEANEGVIIEYLDVKLGG